MNLTSSLLTMVSECYVVLNKTSDSSCTGGVQI